MLAKYRNNLAALLGCKKSMFDTYIMINIAHTNRYLEREVEGGESVLFQEHFFDWTVVGPSKGPSIATRSATLATQPGASRVASGGIRNSGTGVSNTNSGNAPTTRALSLMEKRQFEKSQIDVAALHTLEGNDLTINDDGSSRLDTWIISDYELEEWPANRQGIFFRFDQTST